MPQILPQQKLLLELLVMLGDIGVSSNSNHEILDSTLKECVEKGWIRLSSVTDVFNKASITKIGRAAADA